MGVEKKRVMSESVDEVALRLNISKEFVRGVIESYIDVCKTMLLRNVRVTLFDLVDIVPSDEHIGEYITPTFMCGIVTEEYGYTYTTVVTIIMEYFRVLREDLQNGRPITVRGLCTVYPMQNKEKKVLHAQISRALKATLNSCGVNIRVHTNKLLKTQINYALV